MVIRINSLVESLTESATLSINQQVIQQRLSAKGEEIYHFGFGESPFPVPDALTRALREAVGHKRYLPTRGLPELHDEFVRYYNSRHQTQLTSENIFVGPGSKELIFQLLYLLEGPVIIPAPGWVSYGPQARLLNKRIVNLATRRESGYKLTGPQLDSVCRKLGSEQKILLLNSPNNPTGSIYSGEELVELTDQCRAHNIIVLADEIYELIDFAGGCFESMARYYPEGAIVSTGLSKGFSAGGYRVGMVGIPDTMQELVLALKTLVSETFSCVSTPVQFAAHAAYQFEQDTEEFTGACTRIHMLASNYLYQRLLGMGVDCTEPAGAFYLFPDFGKYARHLSAVGIQSATELCQHLLNRYQVAALPGNAFYMPPESLTMRMASVDYDGADALKAYFSDRELNDEFVRRFMPNLVNGSDALEEFLSDLS
jgi:aspartate/methionine/tyrosine aminotransferase